MWPTIQQPLSRRTCASLLFGIRKPRLSAWNLTTPGEWGAPHWRSGFTRLGSLSPRKRAMTAVVNRGATEDANVLPHISRFHLPGSTVHRDGALRQFPYRLGDFR
jgi:hypothetical protein